MKEDEFEGLRAWGEALAGDQRPEVRAAGRAILMLAEEVEQLQMELWHAKLGVSPQPDQTVEQPDDDEVHVALRSRLRQAAGRASRAGRLGRLRRTKAPG